MDKHLPKGWIPWEGGKCPVDAETCVAIRFRAGESADIIKRANWWRWDHQDLPFDIIAYRLVEPADVPRGNGGT